MTTTEESIRSNSRPAAGLIRAGIVLVIVGAVAVILLDVVTGVKNPEHLRETISEYGLGAELWVFGFGVVSLAIGSELVLLAMVRHRMASVVVRAAMNAWVVGLLVVVLVPKQDWAADPTLGLGGMVHRGGSVVAFLAIPVAVIAAARPWMSDSRWGGRARVTFGLGALSVLTFGPIVYALVIGMLTPTPWWEAVTLGYVERLLVISEVVALLSLSLWVHAVNTESHRSYPSNKSQIRTQS